ncbi:MAG TPA: endonuclease/exonuclease/phosphatase family protein [Haliangiales bacterium]|nr:endonuclease/exonuclease/phosphatase family protein [Haliangiales bacterium]
MRRLIALLFLLGFSRIHAEPLRVTTWNLNFSAQAPTTATDRLRLTNIASILGALNADVIQLQEVPDRQTCERLAALLKPSHYQVAACSAFTDISGGNLSQVAILTKDPVADAWTEPWKPEGWVVPPGGLACAAIRHGAGRVVVYSVQLKNNATGGNFERDTQLNILKRELSAAQLVQYIRSIATELTNPPAAVLIGGSLNTNPDEPQFVSENTLRLLEEAGFTNAFNGVPLKDRITRRGNGRYPDATSDYIFARNATFSGAPNLLASALSAHLPVTCDLLVTAAPPVAKTARPGQWMRPWPLPMAALAALLFLSAWWWVVSRKRFYSPAPVADSRVAGLISFPAEAKDLCAAPEFANPNEPGLPVQSPATDPTDSRIRSLEKRAFAAEQRAARATEAVRQGLVPHLGRLMKDRLFLGVASQRAHLLKIQQAGAAQVAEMEQRLARIQSQLQNRLTAYERRIAELEKELSAKEQANRELLAARMQMMKQVLEAAQAREEEKREKLSERGEVE